VTKLYKKCVFVCALFLFGCGNQNSVQHSFDEYKKSLNRSVWFDSQPSSEKIQLIPLPPLRERKIELTEFDISILDFLSLQQCRIGSLVGQRNSILGKVMPDSQRFLYELNLIQAIDHCQIESDTLRSELFSIRDVKKAELVNAFANSLWAGKESGAFFSLSNGVISMSPDQSSFLSLQHSLSYLLNIVENLERVPQLKSEALEGHFQIIYESEYAGKLLQTLSLVTENLNLISTSLEEINTDDTFCDKPILFLKQQFKVHYIEKIQPYIARINAVAFNVLPVLDELRNKTQPLPVAFNRFLGQWSMTEKNSVWVKYQTASKRHALAWNTLFNECELTYK
jgi:hypothetical protein